MEYGQFVFCKKNYQFYRFIIYRPDIHLYLMEKISAETIIIGGVPFRTNLNYVEAWEKDFQNDYLTSSKDFSNFIQREKQEKLQEIVTPEKLLRKGRILQQQLDCMIRLNKPEDGIKSWKRAIRRNDKKIAHRIELQEMENQKVIDFYDGLLEQCLKQQKKEPTNPFFFE